MSKIQLSPSRLWVTKSRLLWSSVVNSPFFHKNKENWYLTKTSVGNRLCVCAFVCWKRNTPFIWKVYNHKFTISTTISSFLLDLLLDYLCFHPLFLQLFILLVCQSTWQTSIRTQVSVSQNIQIIISNPLLFSVISLSFLTLIPFFLFRVKEKEIK